MKVLTALAARLELGADFRFATDIQAQPGAKQGTTINGDIWINFVGDPTLSRMDLVALFKQLGVTRIQGNVYVNTGAYNGYERGNGWSWGSDPLFRRSRLLGHHRQELRLRHHHRHPDWQACGGQRTPACPSASAPTTWR